MFKQNSSIIAAGLALFSMFFGAGDLIWPLILGGSSGDKNFYAMLGLLITGVTLPLLGVIAMMLFQGDYHAFFGRIGRGPSIALIFIIQAILGPIGSIPRLITLSYATLKPYLAENLSLMGFSILACFVVLLFTLKQRRIVTLLGLVLTPLLLLSIGVILTIGFLFHPEASPSSLTEGQAFTSGIKVGYNTLDLIASFIFAPLVLAHFTADGSAEKDSKLELRSIFKKMLKASFLAAGLLSLMYIGLTYLSSYYTPLLEADHRPEERLSLIAMMLLGPKGALASCIAVAMACMTTAIPLVSIFAKYIKEDLFKNRAGSLIPLLITLGISGAIANLGFMGIANMLGPVLQILCPALIVLSVMNIAHKLFETRVSKVPVFATFAVSTIGHLI